MPKTKINIMKNQNPKIREITGKETRQENNQTPATDSTANTGNNTNTNTNTDDKLLRAIADAGMDLLKQLAKERVTKVITDLQEKGSLNPDNGKQVLEELQRETEIARLRAEQQKHAALAELNPAPNYREFKKLKKKVKCLQQEVKELKAMLLLLGNNSNGKG